MASVGKVAICVFSCIVLQSCGNWAIELELMLSVLSVTFKQ